MESKIATKVQQYEQFLNDSLKEDLKFIESKLKVVNDKLKNWYLLEKSIRTLRDNYPTGFKSYVDIGCGIQCQSYVKDPSVISVNIGLDIYMQMTLDEALLFCKRRTGILNKELIHIQSQANKVKAHIKLVLLALQELQQI